MIPETPWPVCELLEVAAISSGGTPSKSRSEYWEGGDIPWITARDMKTLRIGQTSSMLTAAGAGAARLMPPGTVFVLTRGMTLFRDLPVVLNMETAAFNQDVKALTPSADLDAEFLAAILTQRKSELLQHVSTAGHGTGRLDTQRLELFPVPVPPLPEQRKIAEILRTWDDAIERAEKLMTRLRGKHRLLLQGLVARHAHGSHMALSDLVEPVKTKNNVGETNVLTSSARDGLVSQTEYFNKSVAGKNLAGYYLLHRDDFAYNRSSSSGHPFGAIRRLDRYDRGVISTLYLCFRLRKDSPMSGTFLQNIFNSEVLDRQLSPICHEGARSHGLLNIAQADFFELVVPVPSREAQEIANKAIAASFREIELLQRKAELLRTQKRGLMQKLLTGQVRVNVAAETVAGGTR